MKYTNTAPFAAVRNQSIGVSLISRWLSLVALIGLTTAGTVLAGKATPPDGTPSNLSAIAVASDQINLSWVRNSTTISGFKIERALGSGSFSQIAMVGSTTTTYNDTGLNAGTTYQYRVRSYDRRYTSNYSNIASATTPGGVTTYNISTSSSPAGAGSTSGGGTYNSGSTVTVGASASSCSTFVNWTENGSVVSTSSSYSFTATANRSLVANFTSKTYSIATSASPSAGGSTSGGGTESCGSSVTVSASANSGYNFVNWTENGSVVSSSSSYTFTANANRTLVANFSQSAPSTYSITTSSLPASGGSTSGAGTYNSGSTVTVTATPGSCYSFVNWTENGTVVSSSTSYSFTASANRNLVANFSQISYTITASAAPSAGGTTSGGGAKGCSSSVTVTATANAGYSFVNWTESGTVVSSSTSYSFTASANRNLVANFSQISYTITTSATPSAGGSAGGGGVKTYGSTVSLLATPNAGYAFVNWTENGTVVSTVSSYSFTAIANRTLVANFTTSTSYTISTSPAPSVGGSTSGAGSYPSGATVSLAASANSGYAFNSWNENGVVMSTSPTYNFTATASHTFVVDFVSTSGGPWTMDIGGTGADMGYSVATDKSGNTFAGGYFSGSVNFGSGTFTSAGGQDIFVAKYSPTGTYIWAQHFGGTGDDAAQSVAVDMNGDVVVTGYFSGTATFGTTTYTSLAAKDIFLVKLSGTTGAVLWSKRIGTDSTFGSLNDYGYGVATDPRDGSVVLTGIINGWADFGGGEVFTINGPVFLAKYSAAGAYQWEETFVLTGSGFGQSVAVDASGNILLVGYTTGPINLGGGTLPYGAGPGLYNSFIGKFSPSGAYIWSNAFGGINGNFAKSVAVDGQGNAVVGGYFTGTMSLGNISISGLGGSQTAFVAKLAAGTGATSWAKALTTDTMSAGNSVATDGAGNIIVTGYLQGHLYPDSSVTLTSAGSYDGFAAKYSPTGAYLWALRFGGVSSDWVNGVTVDSSGNVITTGATTGGDFNNATLTSAGGYDIFILKLAP